MIRCCPLFVSPLKQRNLLGLETMVKTFTIPSFLILPPQNTHHRKRSYITPTSSLLLSATKSDNDNNSNKILEETTTSGQYKKMYSITGIGEKSFVSMKTNTGHSLHTDVPKQMGGGDEAPQPVETLLASWVGCTQATALFVGRNMEPRLLIDKIEFDIEAYRDERGALGGELPIKVGSELPDIPARLEKVVGVVKIYSKKRKGVVVHLTEEQLSLLGEHTERRCPVGK